jgi:hypothetical protein
MAGAALLRLQRRGRVRRDIGEVGGDPLSTPAYDDEDTAAST